MTNKQNTNEMLNLCKGAQGKKDVPGWNTLNQYNNISPNKQFDAKVYKKGNTIVLAFAGTGVTPPHQSDLKNDAIILQTNHIPKQYGDAQRLYEQVKKDYPDASIEFTGYSIGGTLANLLSHYSGKPSTAIAPIGSKHIADANPDHFKFNDSNIKTYGVKGDLLFEGSMLRQSGEVFMIDGIPGKKDPFNSHYINNYHSGIFNNAKSKGKTTGGAAAIDKTFTREEIGRMSGEEFAANEKQIMEQLSKGEIQGEAKNFSGYVNPETGSGKIYTREDIGAMNGEEFAKNEKEIMAQMKSDVGIPTKDEMNAISASGDVVWVSDYTRDDGTGVKGYYRSKGK